MRKAIVFMEVPDTLDAAYIQNVIQQHMPRETAAGDYSIEIVPDAITTNARLFYWHRVGDRDQACILSDEQRMKITLRLAENDDYLDEKINQSIDHDIDEFTSIE